MNSGPKPLSPLEPITRIAAGLSLFRVNSALRLLPHSQYDRVRTQPGEGVKYASATPAETGATKGPGHRLSPAFPVVTDSISGCQKAKDFQPPVLHPRSFKELHLLYPIPTQTQSFFYS